MRAYWLALLLLAAPAAAQDCGSGLAAQDAAGTCRADPATMGALEVPGPVATVPPGKTTIAVVAALRSQSVTVSIDADYTNDVTPTDFGNWYSHAAGVQDEVLRAFLRFPLAKIPVGATIVAANVAFVSTGYSNAGDTYLIGAYGGNGLTDPKLGTVSQIFARADVATPYISATNLSGSGEHGWALNASARADLQVALTVGRFTFSVRQQNESGARRFVAIEGYTTATPPVLTVTYKQ